MDEDDAMLSAGFAIDTQGAFSELRRFYQFFDAGTIKVLDEMRKVEIATGGMMKLSGASREVAAFSAAAKQELSSVKQVADAVGAGVGGLAGSFSTTGAAATREAKALAREKNATATAGEALIRTLEREAAALGKTKEEMRSAKVEAIALAASQQGNTDLADRLLAASRQRKFAAEAVAEAEAEAARRASQSAAQQEQALRSAAQAHGMFEAAARRGMAALREQEAAAEKDAAALARLRAMLDPAAAAQERLNRELSEARRVMTAAGASADDMARAQSLLVDRASVATQQHNLMAGAARKNGFALQTVALQLPDITQGLLTGQKPMTVFIQQGFQIVQVAQMAEGGLRGFGRELGGLALRFAPFLAGLAVAGAGFALFTRWINQGVTNNQLTKDLGDITGGADATKQELFKLKDATITWGDVAKALFSEVGKDVASVFVGDMKSMNKDVKSVLDDLTSYGRAALAGLYAGVAGSKAYLGALSSREGLVKLVTGDPTLLDRTYGEAYRKADAYLGKLGKRVKKAAVDNARDRLADSIGFNTPPKPRVDHHADTLAREAEAVEAQIRNLYKLTDAYGVSGAAALVAEARVKAETDAIKKRGDIEAFVDRQVRLAIAERVKSAAQGSATMREQAAAQADVNAMVANGLVPAARADEIMQARIRELPLLAAIEVAQQRGLTVEASRATRALEDQRDAQLRVNATEIGKRFILADKAADQRLAEIREEARLIGATDMERVKALATIRATNEALTMGGKEGTPYFTDYVGKQVDIALGTARIAAGTRELNDELSFTADLWDSIGRNVQNAATGMADAFGETGRAIGDMAAIFTDYRAQEERARTVHAANIKAATSAAALERENAKYALATSTAQVGAFGDMASAAKGFFGERSKGYAAMQTAEKAFRAVEFALSVRAMAQDAIETGSSIAKSVARTTVSATEAIVNAIKSLPFPLNLAAGAATAGAIAALGVSIVGSFGGGNKLPASNTGTGTVLGDREAKSESIKRAIDGLKDVDTLMLSSSREMAGLLRSIDSQIGGVAALVVRAGDINASAGVKTGMNNSTGRAIGTGVGGAVGAVAGSILGPFGTVLGGLVGSTIGKAIGSLFGTKTSVVGGGLSGGPQTLESILNGGFDASYYSDVQKKKKLFGITTSTKYSTQYAGADAGLENQFTLILKGFNSAIAAAAGPLGESTDEIQRRLNGFVVNIGKIDLQGLTGEQIEEKLGAVFGAAADNMALAAFPGFERFQKVGEGAFETLVRVASTVEAVSASLDMLGGSARGLGIDAKLGLADQFDSVGDFNSAASAYFDAFYTKEEQAAAKMAQFSKVFDSLGLAMPDTLAGFRGLVDAQNLTTAAGQSTYATLLQLAPAFADLKSAMEGANSAADILAERQDLERRMLELNGDTAAIRALDLAKVDASNRTLQQQVWAVEDAQKAADAAKQLSDAWSSVGSTIEDEIKRIRGLSDGSGGNSFAAAMGQFNAATIAARGGDMDAAKMLPGLSQALLKLAGDNATSRQELDRVQAQTAASLETTSSVIAAIAKGNPLSAAGTVSAAAVAAQAAAPVISAANDTTDPIRELREALEKMHNDNNAGHAATAGNTQRIARHLDDVTAASGGDAIAVVSAA